MFLRRSKKNSLEIYTFNKNYINSPTYNFLFSTEICMALHSFIDGISGNEGKHFVMILISCAEGDSEIKSDMLSFILPYCVVYNAIFCYYAIL